jgi:hypothetical protein
VEVEQSAARGRSLGDDDLDGDAVRLDQLGARHRLGRTAEELGRREMVATGALEVVAGLAGQDEGRRLVEDRLDLRVEGRHGGHPT